MKASKNTNFIDVEPENEAAYALMAQLHRRAFEAQGEKAWTVHSFRELLKSPGMKATIVEKEGSPFGFFLYRIVTDEAELISIGLDPLYQGQGLAALLLSQLQSDLALAGVKQLFLEVREGNEKAIKLYTGFGFKKIGERK
ncbi:MAG: GNAT family N-acetyltransferase, partial [Kordiimonadaceae bacterium]|nr:GNAT family N-acetyltransferase [Kordiimonadaceae bacterium]